MFSSFWSSDLERDTDPHWDLDPDPQLEKMLYPQTWFFFCGGAGNLQVALLLNTVCRIKSVDNFLII
jgi:hypothetical protein